MSSKIVKKSVLNLRNGPFESSKALSSSKFLLSKWDPKIIYLKTFQVDDKKIFHSSSYQQVTVSAFVGVL